MSAPDIAGVLLGALRGHRLDTMSQDSGKHCICGSDSRFKRSDGTGPWSSIDEHRAQVVEAAIRAELRAWLESEAENVARALFVTSGTPESWWPDHRKGYEQEARAALAALAEQVGAADQTSTAGVEG